VEDVLREAIRSGRLTPGTAGWPAYEKYCEDLLSFLFVPR
jgi:hypothetical protein